MWLLVHRFEIRLKNESVFARLSQSPEWICPLIRWSVRSRPTISIGDFFESWEKSAIRLRYERALRSAHAMVSMTADERHLTVLERSKIQDADSSTQPYLIPTKLDRYRLGSAQRRSRSTTSFFASDKSSVFVFWENMAYCSRRHPFTTAYKSCFKEIFAKGKSKSSDFL
jgi:hypothetical protein